MARIGFYGGTFNPIHMGHVGVCRQAVKQLRLDCLHVIPAFIPPHKVSPDLAAGEDGWQCAGWPCRGCRISWRMTMS